MKFTMYNPVKINFGTGQILGIEETVRFYGKKVFIATMTEVVNLGSETIKYADIILNCST